MTISILVNGAVPPDLTHALAANDRGFHYGDGLFETALLRDGSVRFLDAHLNRLDAGCERLNIVPPGRAVLLADIAQVSAKLRSGVLKIIVTRGQSDRGYRPLDASHPTRLVALYPAPRQETTHLLRLRWCDIRLGRNARLAGIKHLNRLEQVLAQAEWSDATIDEGLMLDTEGEVVSGTASNVFVVRDGTLLTPDLRFCGVQGIMRAQVLGIAQRLGMSTGVEPLWPKDLSTADEVFVTNAVRGIRSVGSLESMQWSRTTVADALKGSLV